MSELIKDGRGSGYKAAVDNENRLMTRSVTTSVEHNHNILHGSAYNMVFSVTPSASDAPFLYIKNTDSYNLVLSGINIRSSIDNVITLNLGDTGSLIDGVDIVPSSLNASSKRTPVGVFKKLLELENIDGGVPTALYYVPGDNLSRHFNFEIDIAIPKNTVASFYSKNANADLSGFVIMWWDYRQYQ
jgi:hypothetical protein